MKGITVITNSTNLGFARACNQGLAEPRGEFVLLLNNDVIVTEGWLGRLTGLLTSHPQIGAVGPRANFAASQQHVMCGYLSAQEMEEYAREVDADYRGQWFATDRLMGFCLLVRREALDRIGVLDERFEVGMFEDDDLCLRLRQAGYTLAVAADCFVHSSVNRVRICKQASCSSALGGRLNAVQ